MERRAVIRFFTHNGLKTQNIYIELESVYGPEALVLLTVKKWRRHFQQGRTNLFDNPRSTSNWFHACREAIQFVQGGLSPLPDWKGDMLADLSRQAWFKRIPFSLGAAHSIDQPKG
jgi:hypothetical protein